MPPPSPKPHAPSGDSSRLPWYTEDALPREVMFPPEAKKEQKGKKQVQSSSQQQNKQQKQPQPQPTQNENVAHSSTNDSVPNVPPPPPPPPPPASAVAPPTTTQPRSLAQAPAASAPAPALFSAPRPTPPPPRPQEAPTTAAVAPPAAPSFNEKSLWFCIVLVNPFHAARTKIPHIPAPGSLKGYPASADFAVSGGAASDAESDPDSSEDEDEEKRSGLTLLQDEDFLRVPNFFRKTNLNAPNIFQKIIEMIRRLELRGLTVHPTDMLLKTPGPSPHEPWNYLPASSMEGYVLDEDKLLLSADGDDMYIKVHAARPVLQEYCESHFVNLRTNPYSIAGGIGISYSKELDEKFASSVKDFLKHADVAPGDEYCEGKDGRPFGFSLEVPTKQRLVARMLREGWRFGGVGLQLERAMAKKDAFVKDYFPLHNRAYIHDYGIDTFCSVGGMLSDIKGILDFAAVEFGLCYCFGEQVALYFFIVHEFLKKFLLPCAVVGLCAGIIGEYFWGTGIEALAGCVYTIIILCISAFWCKQYSASQDHFAFRHGQEIEARSEPAREAFHPQRKRVLSVAHLLSLNFELPLSFLRDEDGTMIELVFPHAVRLKRRFLISYPLILLLAAAMVVCLFLTQVYRMSDPSALGVSIAASVFAVLVSIVFGRLFLIMAELLCEFENIETDTRFEAELVSKSFPFYAISTYLPVLFIMFWPDTAGMTIESERQNREKQLRTQLVVQLAVMPLVQNLVEVGLPVVLAALRRRVDETGGWCGAICSFICCCCYGTKSKQSTAAPGPRLRRENYGSSNNSNNNETHLLGSDVDDPEDERFFESRRHKHQLGPSDPAYECWSQSLLEKYRPLEKMEDVLEMILFFGWTVLSAGFFPWAPLLGLFFFTIEIRVDAKKLLKFTQRPVARVAQSLGPYASIFAFLTICGCLLNTYYLIFVSRLPSTMGWIDVNETAVTFANNTSTSDRTTRATLMEAFIWLQYIFSGSALCFFVLGSGSSTLGEKTELKKVLLRDTQIQNQIGALLHMSATELEKFSKKKSDALREMEMMTLALKSSGKSGSRGQCAALAHACCCCGSDEDDNDGGAAATNAAATMDSEGARQLQRAWKLRMKKRALRHQQNQQHAAATASSDEGEAFESPINKQRRTRDILGKSQMTTEEQQQVLASIASAKQRRHAQHVQRASKKLLVSPSSPPEAILIDDGSTPSPGRKPQRQQQQQHPSVVAATAAASPSNRQQQQQQQYQSMSFESPPPQQKRSDYDLFFSRHANSLEMKQNGMSATLSRQRNGVERDIEAGHVVDETFICEVMGRHNAGASEAASTPKKAAAAAAAAAQTNPLEM